MKKLTTLLLIAILIIPQITAYAFYGDTEKYSAYIAEAVEKSGYKDDIDMDNIYIIEKTNVQNYKNNGKLLELYVATPIKDTKDITYSIFRNGEYIKEVFNSASFLHLENHLNTQIDKYLENNKLKNVTEAVNTLFYGRTEVDCYCVVSDSETYFIPYRLGFSYNSANDEECALELGKAYKEADFINRIEKEEISYIKYQEELKKAEEEKLAAEKKAEEEKYTPTVGINESGDEIIKVNGYNLDDILNILDANINSMGFSSTINIGIKTDTKDYLSAYRWQKGCNTGKISKFAEGLFDEIKTQVISGKPSSVQNASYCKFNLKHDEGYTSIKHSVEISVWSDGVKVTVGKDDAVIEMKVKNSKEIIDYIDSFGNNSFEGFQFTKNDEYTPTSHGTLDGMSKTDVIEFNLKLTDAVKGSLSDEAADVGETVHGVFEKYKENKYNSTYILTLSGSKGTISLYCQNQSSLSGTDEYFSNNIPLSFFDNFRFENGQLTEYIIGKTSDTYKFKMVFENGDIAELYFDNTACTDLKYIKLSEDTKLSDEYTEKNKEAVIRDAKECADSLYKKGLFKGTDKGYEFEKGLTREESATILVRLLGKENSINADDFDAVFTDVDKNRWSYPYVMYCYKNNITKGTGISTFSPDTQIDASQFVTLIMRLLGYTEVNPDTALDKGAKHRLISSDMAEKLKKSEAFTRSEMVQIVYNCLEIKNTKQIG